MAPEPTQARRHPGASHRGAGADDAAVLLDAMGTLVELEPPIPHLRRALADRLGVRVDAATAGRALAAEIAYYRAHMGAARDPASLATLRTACAAVLQDALGSRAAGAGPAAMVEVLLAALVFRPFPDAAPALRALRAEGRRLVVASNWDVSLEDVLERGGLRSLLDGVVTSAAAGAAKPDRAVFDRALALAGVTADRAVHVGDSIAEDVRGALAAGIVPVLIRRGPGDPTAPEGVRVVRSLTDLVAGAT